LARPPLGEALLRQGIQALHERGHQRVGLHADGENLTGAVRIYRKVGMDILHVHDNYELELRPGKELRVTG
jgi:ribosomal protein S18 acetylase RimI-like enzyme